MKMYIDGGWTDSPNTTRIFSPYTHETIDTVPEATAEHVERALGASEKAAIVMASLTAHERYQLMMRAADILTERVEELAQTISLEEGKPILESRGEVGRSPDLLRLCAFEGSQMRGETLPADAQAGVRDKLAFTLRVPCGVVVAISPFNYPLLLVLHKVGPALAAGNAVILKPAGRTPLTALKLTQIFLEAGLPDNAFQCITGAGSKLGPLLCSDRRVRKISFTGSTEVGEKLARVAGVKRLSLELGSNCPIVVLPDADLDEVADAAALGGFINAGQVCISVQNVLVHEKVYSDFLEVLKPRVEAIKVGNPMAEDTMLGAMITQEDAQRVGDWVSEAIQGGASVVTGGERIGAVFAPTVVADVKPQMRMCREELFGPAVAVSRVESLEEAIALINSSSYGLGAGVFTRDISHALRFARRVMSGSVNINWTTLWRADLMPYGGFKGSGIGKEGPRYAIDEMTEVKAVIIHRIDGN